MKKMLAIILVLVMAVPMTACSETFTANDPFAAYVEITTSTGYAYNTKAYRFINNSQTGLDNALSNQFTLYLEEGESATIHFFCEQCQKDEIVELTAPAARVFSCDCVTGDKTDGLKEYFAIALILGQDGSES